MAETHEPFSDELISAYLDGEVSSSERALIEHRLQQDPQTRHLYEQLRAIREMFQDLPRETLDEGLYQRVLQRTRNIPSAAAAAAEGAQRSRPRHGLRRGLVWAALAVAAALMLMVVGPREGEDGRQLASAPSSKDTGSSSVSPPAAGPTPTLELAPAEQQRDDRASNRALSDAAPPSRAASAPADRRSWQTELPRDASMPTRGADGNRSRGDEPVHAGRQLPVPRSPGLAASADQRLPLAGALRVEVTSDQLTEIMGRLREAQLNVMPAAVTRNRTEAQASENQADSVEADSTALSDVGPITGVIVQASLADVQTVLRRANVQAVPIALNELELTDLPLAGDELRPDAERGTERVAERVAPAASQPRAGEKGAPVFGGTEGRSAGAASARPSEEFFAADAQSAAADPGASSDGVPMAVPPAARSAESLGRVLIVWKLIEPPAAPSTPSDIPVDSAR